MMFRGLIYHTFERVDMSNLRAATGSSALDSLDAVMESKEQALLRVETKPVEASPLTECREGIAGPEKAFTCAKKEQIIRAYLSAICAMRPGWKNGERDEGHL